MTIMLLEIWLISKFILEKFSANIYPSLLLRREGKKPHAFAGPDVLNNVENALELDYEDCFGKKQDAGAVAAAETAALCYQMLSLLFSRTS